MSNTNGLGAAPEDRRYRLKNSDTGIIEYAAHTCTELREHITNYFRYDNPNDWGVEWLSPNPHLGWLPMNLYQFEQELKRETLERIRGSRRS